MSRGRILIIDDEPAYLEPNQERLIREGYQAEMAADRVTALARLDDPEGWDVVLLDVKLRGKEGPDEGLDMLADVQDRAPFAKVIMISGIADEQTVKPAFAQGAYDYLEKGRLFGSLLSVKVRNAIELARERRLGALDAQDREHLLQQLHQDVLQEKNKKLKGALLEELMIVLFKSIPGFEEVNPHVRSAAEEIDLTVMNQSADPLWRKESKFFLVECKNWSRKTERHELDAFAGKLLRRGERCNWGFFVAVGGFSQGFTDMLGGYAMRGFQIVPVDQHGLEGLVLAADGGRRNDVLKGLYQKAVLQSKTEIPSS